MSTAFINWPPREQPVKDPFAMGSQQNTLDEFSSCHEDGFTSCSLSDSSQRSLMLLEGIEDNFEVGAGEDLAFDAETNDGGGSESCDLDAIDAHGEDAEADEIEVEYRKMLQWEKAQARRSQDNIYKHGRHAFVRKRRVPTWLGCWRADLEAIICAIIVSLLGLAFLYFAFIRNIRLIFLAG